MEKKPTNKVETNNKNTMETVYALLGASSPLEMNSRYVEEDQRLFKAGEWDYNNDDLIVNRVKTVLENIDESLLTAEEYEWRQEILWFWYHHAISIAVWKYKEHEAAKAFAQKALELQPEDHPNQITRLLYLLVHDNAEAAHVQAASISEEPERQTAIDLITDYESKPWFQ